MARFRSRSLMAGIAGRRFNSAPRSSATVNSYPKFRSARRGRLKLSPIFCRRKGVAINIKPISGHEAESPQPCPTHGRAHVDDIVKPEGGRGAPSDLSFTPAEKLVRDLNKANEPPHTPEELEQWRQKREAFDHGDLSPAEARHYVQEHRGTYRERGFKPLRYTPREGLRHSE